MTGMLDEERSQLFLRVLGEELRRVRTNNGWSRQDMADRLGISTQTVATWELGSRHCAANRVWQWCEVLDEPIDELYARVRTRLGRTRLDRAQRGLLIDLRSAESAQVAQLGPLRGWAQIQLRTNPNASTAVFDASALDRMAELCALTTVEFVDRLYRTGLICAEPQLPAERDT